MENNPVLPLMKRYHVATRATRRPLGRAQPLDPPPVCWSRRACASRARLWGSAVPGAHTSWPRNVGCAVGKTWETVGCGGENMGKLRENVWEKGQL